LLPLLLLPLLLQLAVLRKPLPLKKRKRKKKKLASTVLDPFSVETGIERRRAHKENASCTRSLVMHGCPIRSFPRNTSPFEGGTVG
jgi:hypothetical protein